MKQTGSSRVIAHVSLSNRLCWRNIHMYKEVCVNDIFLLKNRMHIYSVLGLCVFILSTHKKHSFPYQQVVWFFLGGGGYTLYFILKICISKRKKKELRFIDNYISYRKLINIRDNCCPLSDPCQILVHLRTDHVHHGHHLRVRIQDGT